MAVEKLKRPQPRPLPPGLRFSPDSDDGFRFDIPKYRGKLARALDKHQKETQPLNAGATTTSAVGSGQSEPAATPNMSSHPLEPRKPSSNAQAAEQSNSVAQRVPQKPPSVVSPGGRHYSGLFPSSLLPSTGQKALTGPGVFPHGASSYSARFLQSVLVSDSDSEDLISSLQQLTKSNSKADNNDNAVSDTMEEVDSDSQPVPYSLDPHEDKIIRLCIRHGLDPRADYAKMARVYLAAKKKRQAEDTDDQIPVDHEQEESCQNSSGGSNGGNGGCGDGGGGDGGGGDDGDGGSSSSGDGGGDSDDDAADEDDDDRYGPEHDPWLIDPSLSSYFQT